MNDNQIIYLEADTIYPHPNNPRKGLGDLSELAESIKANGIMQNLTVVRQPWSVNDTKPIKYTVVIGHRRLAAAKLAGLTEVPCVITEMDEKEQVATMLLENMQRSDLTLYEQAQGMQMMLDFGETVGGISEKTGFSESTVRRRVRLLDLDKDKFKESVDRGATLQDYAELDKIQDIDLKNSVLAKIGTSNFDYALRSAIDTEKWNKTKTGIIDTLKEFANQVDASDGYRRVTWYTKWGHIATETIEKPYDAGSAQYFFCDLGDTVYLLKEDNGEPGALSEAQRERQRIRDQHDELDEISRRAYQLRSDFIRNFKAGKKYSGDIMEFSVRSMIRSGWSNFDEDLFMEMLDLDLDEDDELSFETVSGLFATSPERILLITAYCNDADDRRLTYYDWDCRYEENEDLDAIYSFLEKLGYELSDEEQALRDGTHELFVCGDEKE